MNIKTIADLSFHPSKEGFKVCRREQGGRGQAPFPSLKGRFQRGMQAGFALDINSVSIPQRKVSKPRTSEPTRGRPAVSIPQRKVSKGRKARLHVGSRFVSIPQRKVSKARPSISGTVSQSGFHPSKEGFKAAGRRRSTRAAGRFPSLKGRFQSV